MENASKALLMAAGMLIGLLIAGLFAYEMMSVAQTGKAHQAQIDHEQVLEFNAQFEKYNNKPLTSQEVATIFNYVMEWNEEREADRIEMIFRNENDGRSKLGVLKGIYNNHETDVKYKIEEFLESSLIETKNTNDIKYSNKIYTIKITDKDYTDREGRIKKITFRYIENDPNYEKYFEVK